MPLNPATTKEPTRLRTIEAGLGRHSEVVIFALGVILGAVLGGR